MSYTNETTHYHIPKPLGTDLTTPMDYNDAADAIDTAVWGAVQDAAQATSDASDAKTTANSAAGAVTTLEGTVTTLEGTVGTQGTAITNLGTEVSDVRTDLSDAICAVKEASATAAYAHAVGTYFWYNDTLYKTTQAIATGATIVPNTNCVTTNVTTEITPQSVSVTSDGVKTYGQVLNDLAALVDFTKIRSGSVLEAIDATKTTIATVENISSTAAVFTRVANVGETITIVAGIKLAVNDSTNVNAGIGATTYSYNDGTNTTCPAATTFKLIY